MKRLTAGLLFATTALFASGTWAQAPAPEQPSSQPQAAPAPPPALTVAPTAPKSVPERSAAGGQPANICTELVAYLEQAAQSSSGAQPQGQSSPAQTTAPSAPPTSAPQGQASASTPPGVTAPAVDRPQFQSGMVAPVPPPESAQPPPHLTVDQARTLEQSNDRRGCQDAVRKMRRAGVKLPDGLMALAALRPELLERQPSRQ